MTPDEEKTLQEAAEERKQKLGRPLARLKLNVDLEKRAAGSVPDVIFDNDMRMFLHAVIDAKGAELIEVVENFADYVLEARERIEGVPFSDPADPPKDANGV
jgi:hypothetical protein